MFDSSSHDNKQEENNLHLSVCAYVRTYLCVYCCVSVVCVHAGTKMCFSYQHMYMLAIVLVVLLLDIHLQ